MNKKSTLLCTFSTQELVSRKVDEIRRKFDIQFNKIFVLKNINNDNEWYITYNVQLSFNDNYKDLITNTINLHRNKDTNSLYTINALNEVIKLHNNGVLDVEYKIDWENYRSSIILYRNGSLVVIKTKVENIINL